MKEFTVDTPASSVLTLDVAGTPEQMGRAHGDGLRTMIRDLYEVRADLLLSASGASLARLREAAEVSWRTVTSSVPLISREVAATAAAAGLQTWQLVVAGAYTDLGDVLRIADSDLAECSIGMMPSSRAVYGTWDSHPEAAAAMLVLRRTPLSGPQTIALTTAGWPCQFGVNSDELAFAITNLTPADADPAGLVYIAAVAQLAGMSASKPGVEWLTRQSMASGHSYLLMDSINSYAVETSPSGASVVSSDEPWVETNHYQSALDDNGRYPFLEFSVQRCAELADSLRSFDGDESFRGWLQNSNSVFRRFDPNSSVMTCAAFVLDPTRGGIWLASTDEVLTNMNFYGLIESGN